MRGLSTEPFAAAPQAVAPQAASGEPEEHALLRRFAVKGVLWRHYLDFAVANVPFYLQPILLWSWTVFFFFLAAPARRAVVTNLAIMLPGSSPIVNHFRAFRTLMNFAWTIAEAANYKMNKARFAYEIDGAEQLEQLASTRGAIVLTAHMGSYDLGAALFAQKFNREIRMVRAPEPDYRTAQHLDTALQQTGEGAVKIDYNTEGSLLAFDLLGALRRGEIVSIQGDRAIAGAGSSEGEMFGHPVLVPSGPFTLALVSERPIYPLFIARAGYRRYRIMVREPLVMARSGRSREHDIEAAVEWWCGVLQAVIAQHWAQWFAFASPFVKNANA